MSVNTLTSKKQTTYILCKSTFRTYVVYMCGLGLCDEWGFVTKHVSSSRYLSEKMGEGFLNFYQKDCRHRRRLCQIASSIKPLSASNVEDGVSVQTNYNSSIWVLLFDFCLLTWSDWVE